MTKPQFKVLAWTSVNEIVNMKKTRLEHIEDFVLGEKAMFRANSLKDVYRLLKEAGVDGIELLIPYHTTDHNITDVMHFFKTVGLPILSLHQSLQSLRNISMDEIERLGMLAKQINAGVVTLHSGALGNKLFDAVFISRLKALEKKYSVKFGIENMPRSPLSIGRSYSYDPGKFTRMITAADLSVTYDVTHIGQVGGDMLNFYTQNKERIVNIHLSDYQRHWKNRGLLLQSYTHLPLLMGELPINHLLLQLKKNHYAGLITMEIKGSLDDLCRSARIIKSL